MRVTEVQLNEEYLIAKQSNNIDYVDVFQVEIESLEPPAPKDCMVAFFRSFPPFFTALLLLREKIAGAFGLKTAPENTQEAREKQLNEFQGNVGDHIAIFEVLDKNSVELLTGQKDKHLDFKLSFISYQKDNHSIIELATTVVIHNALGKAYFSIVRPIHRIYMKRIMRRMVKKLHNSS